jgi:hypothetical protein
MISCNFVFNHSLTASPPCPSKTLSIVVGVPAVAASDSYVAYRSSFCLRTVPFTLALPLTRVVAAPAAADATTTRATPPALARVLITRPSVRIIIRLSARVVVVVDRRRIAVARIVVARVVA